MAKKKKVDKIDIAYWVIVIILFMIVLGTGIRSCKIGTDPDDYEDICIEGHMYHTVNFGQKMAITIKLDDKGRPIKCQN